MGHMEMFRGIGAVALVLVMLGWMAEVPAAVPASIAGLASGSHTVNQKSAGDTLTLRWDASLNAAGYSYVLDGVADTVPDAVPELTPGGVTSLTLRPADGSHYFHLRAIGDLGEGSAAEHIGPFIIDTTAPSPVSGFTAQAMDGRATLSWTTPGAADFQRVMVRYRTDGRAPDSVSDGTLAVEDVTTARASAASYVHQGLSNGTTYRYAAFALDDVGNTSLIATTSVLPQADALNLSGVNPDSGSNAGTITVTLSGTGFSDTLTTADVTLGGSAARSLRVTSANELIATFDLSAMAVGSYSVAVSTARLDNAFSVNDTTAPTVSASPGAGSYDGPREITLTASESAVIYYTTDGSTPTAVSSVYGGAITLARSATLNYVAVDGAGNAGAVVASAYVITADITPPTVAAAPPGGSYTGAQQVTLSADEVATIYYTVDGGAPGLSSMLYSGAISVESTTSVRFFAVDVSGNRSVSGSADYSIVTPTPTPVPSPLPSSPPPPVPPAPPPETLPVPVPPDDSVVNGERDNSGRTLTDPTIEAGAVLTGGTLGGSVINGGTIRDVFLEGGARVDGGVLSGVVEGDPDDPPTLNAAIEAGSELRGVVLGATAELDASVRLGQGVRFERNGSIPAGIDLGDALGRLGPTIDGVIQPDGVDLMGNVIAGGTSGILDAINDLPALSEAGFIIAQDPLSGDLEVAAGEMLLTLRPLTVRQAAADAVPGLQVDPDGRTRVVTGDGREVIAQPVVQDMEGFVRGVNGAIQVTDDGDLTVQVGGAWFRARPSIFSSPAPPEASEGLALLPHDRLLGVEQVSLIFPGEGGPRRQLLPSAPLDRAALGAAVAVIPGVDGVDFDGEGGVSVRMAGQTLEAVFDYGFVQGTPPVSGGVEFVVTDDVNGDGVDDLTVVYPNGARQLLYMVP